MVSFMFKISFMIFCLKILYLSTYIVHTLCSGMSYIMLDDVGTFKRVPLSTTVQACRSRGCLHSIPRFWQISQPYLNQGGQINAQYITTSPPPPGFSDLPKALSSTTTISCTELSRVAVQSAQCRVNIWKGSFFHHFYSRALAMAACSILCCWLSRWRYWLYFSPFFHWTQTSKVTKIQYGWKYKTLSDWYFFMKSYK